MNRYAAYGLRIESEFELPELPERDATDGVDAVFRRGDVEPVPETVDGTGGRRIEATPGQCRLSYDSIGSFLVEDGDRVTFDPVAADTTENKFVNRLFENEMLGLLLHQRGALVLHASAVSLDDEAAIFLGPRGAGKSTTAAAFHRFGYPILEDDVVAISFEGPHPTVLPGVPELRLKPDAVDGLDIPGTTRHPDDGGSGKRYQRVDDVPEPAPLGGCYFLREGDGLSIEPVDGENALLELVARTYARGLLEDTETTPDHFRQCSDVVRKVPFSVLERPDDHGRLDDLVELVAEHVTQPSETAEP